MSTLDHTLEPKGATVRRLEVITGTGRRRRFSADDKVLEVEIEGVTVRVGRGADAKTVAAVLRALRGGA